MAKLTEEQASQLRELQRLQGEAEKEEKEAERVTKEAEDAKKRAIANGSSDKTVEAKTDAVEIARMSESSAAALTERIDAMLNLMEESLRKQGVPEEKIQEAKRRKWPGRSR
jgi:hypothetical protein